MNDVLIIIVILSGCVRVCVYVSVCVFDKVHTSNLSVSSRFSFVFLGVCVCVCVGYCVKVRL